MVEIVLPKEAEMAGDLTPEQAEQQNASIC
jgi:hypothetical protein